MQLHLESIKCEVCLHVDYRLDIECGLVRVRCIVMF